MMGSSTLEQDLLTAIRRRTDRPVEFVRKFREPLLSSIGYEYRTPIDELGGKALYVTHYMPVDLEKPADPRDVVSSAEDCVQAIERAVAEQQRSLKGSAMAGKNLIVHQFKQPASAESDTDYFWAYSPELPGAIGWGETEGKALESFGTSYLRVLLCHAHHGRRIPFVKEWAMKPHQETVIRIRVPVTCEQWCTAPYAFPILNPIWEPSEVTAALSGRPQDAPQEKFHDHDHQCHVVSTPVESSDDVETNVDSHT
jgi:hypothetical protein